MASRLTLIAGLCALTTASIYPLSAGPRSIMINKDGTSQDRVQTHGAKEGRVKGPKSDKDRGSRRYKHKINDDGTVDDPGDTGGTGTDTGGTGGDTGGTDGGTGGGDDVTNSSDLPPIDLSDMRLWNWSGKWHASQWDHAFSTIPWRFDHVVQDDTGDTHFLFDENGAPELKASGGHPYSRKARYEVDVSLPQMRSGMIVAPLWLWHNDTKDEVDFEFVGQDSLQLTIHTRRHGSHKKQGVKIAGDFSGQRMKLAIETDLDAGEIRMYVDGQLVHTFLNNTLAFPTGNMRPVMSMWVGDNVGWAEAWAGPWGGFAPGEVIAFTIHGYKFTPM